MVRKLGLIFSVAMVFGGCLGVSSSAFAQLIAYDSFEDVIYSDGGPPLDGVPLQQTGPESDWGNPPVSPGWVGDAAESGPAIRKWLTSDALSFVYRLGSLHHSTVDYDDSSTGMAEAVLYTGAANFRSIRRVIDAYQPASTYYMSFFVNTSSLAAGELGQRGQALVGFTGVTMSENAYNNIGTGEIFGLLVGFDGRGTNQRISDLVLRTRIEVEGFPTPQFTNSVLLQGDIANPMAPADQHVSTLENMTHLVMLKLEVNVEGQKDMVTYWVNPTDVSTESMATSTAQATGVLETYSIDTTNRLTRLQIVANRYEDRSFFLDEPRFGYDFYSVAGVSAPSLIGDYNNDGVVDAGDYVMWRDNLGGSAMLPNDATPGVNDESDFTNWRANFGLEAPVGSGAAATVPEPGTVWLLIPLLAGLLVRTRGRARK